MSGVIYTYFRNRMQRVEIKPNPASSETKKIQVEQMFDSIAPRYDFLNHTLSLGIDRLWRKAAIRSIKPYAPQRILDVATGTADLAIACNALKPQHITGIDISQLMLDEGSKKIAGLGLQQRITLTKADSEALPFEDNSFDAITVAFGVRNFENLAKGLEEMRRVLKPGGVIAILEFSNPTRFPFKQLYQFYFNKILPFLGKRVSKSENAYAYLPESVKYFPDGKVFLEYLNRAGYNKPTYKPLTFGVCTLYNAIK